MRLWKRPRPSSRWTDYSTGRFDIPVLGASGFRDVLARVHGHLKPEPGGRAGGRTRITSFFVEPEPGAAGTVRVHWTGTGCHVGHLPQDLGRQLHHLLGLLERADERAACNGRLYGPPPAGKDYSVFLSLDVASVIARATFLQERGAAWAPPSEP